MNLNRVYVGGNIVRDPELRFGKDGSPITKITIANNFKYKTKDGQIKDNVTYVDVTAFGKTAENIGQFFKKGSTILIEGRLKTESWEDKNTKEKRSKLAVVADGFQFCGRNEAASDGAPIPPRTPTQVRDNTDDVIPF